MRSSVRNRVVILVAAAAAAIAMPSASAEPGFTAKATITAADGAASDYFGFDSIAVSGDTLVAGASLATVGGNYEQGAVYVFRRAGSAWTQEAKLTRTGGTGSEHFGASVAISGDTILVGVPRATESVPGDGRAYVYTRSGTTWTEQAALTSPNKRNLGAFGTSVALEGDVCVIGAPGELTVSIPSGNAHVFTRSGTTWTHAKALEPQNAAANGRFGASLTLAGGTIAVGAPQAFGPAGSNQGSVDVFTSSGGIWTRQASLVASDPQAQGRFGSSLAVEGDRLAVGCAGKNVGSNAGQGSVYVFARNGTTWAEEAQLSANDGEPYALHGYSVALRGDDLLMGGNGSTVTEAVHRFRRTGGTWTHEEKLTVPGGASVSSFGNALALPPGGMFISAPDLTVGGNVRQGAVFEFAAQVPSDQYLLPSSVTVKVNAKKPSKSKVTASAMLNTAHAAPDWTAPLHLDLGGLGFEVPGLTAVKNGKSYAYSGDGLVLGITPGKGGSSKAKVTVSFTGDLGGAVSPDGDVTLALSGGAVDARGTVTLTNGKYLSKKGAIEAGDADFEISSLVAKLGGDGADTLSLTAQFAADGTAPDTAPDVSVSLGDLAVTVPGAAPGFTRKGEVWTFKGNELGITSVAIDYVRGTLKVKGSKLTLGTFADGAVPLTVTLTAGDAQAKVNVTAVNAKGTLKY